MEMSLSVFRMSSDMFPMYLYVNVFSTVLISIASDAVCGHSRVYRNSTVLPLKSQEEVAITTVTALIS